LTVVGLLFAPLLCIGIPLLIVGLILVVAEGGRTGRAPMPPGPGYGAAYQYPQYPSMPPAAAPPPQGQIPSPPSTLPPSSACANCGSSLMPGASFCVNCGAPVRR